MSKDFKEYSKKFDMSRMDYSTSLYKTTKNGVYHKPKPKHMLVILHTLQGFNPKFKPDGALSQMFELIRGKRACSILKTVYCLHVCMQELSPGFSRRLVVEQSDNELLNDTDSWGKFYNGLAVSYWRYLKAVANLRGNYQNILARQFDSLEQILAEVPILELLKETEILVDFYEKAAFNREPLKYVMTYKRTEIAVVIFEKLLEDISAYHRIVVHTLDGLMSRIEEMNLNVLKYAYDLTRRFASSQDNMKELIKLGYEFEIRNVPDLELRDNSMNRILESTIRQLTVTKVQTPAQTPKARRSVDNDLLIFEEPQPRQPLREVSNAQATEDSSAKNIETKSPEVVLMVPTGYAPAVPMMMMTNMMPMYQAQWTQPMFSPRNPFM